MMYGETVLNSIDLNRPAKPPDLGRKLPVVSLLCRISGFDVHFAGICFSLLALAREVNLDRESGRSFQFLLVVEKSYVYMCLYSQRVSEMPERESWFVQHLFLE